MVYPFPKNGKSKRWMDGWMDGWMVNTEHSWKIRSRDEKVMARGAKRADHRSGLLNAANIQPLRPIRSSHDYVWHDWTF